MIPGRQTLLGLLILATGCQEPVAVVLEPLRVIQWAPPSGAFCIPIDVTVSATFSADLEPDTVIDESFRLLDADGVVASTLEYDQPTFTVRLQPSEVLRFDRLYTVVATTEITAVERGRLAVDLDASFVTTARHGCAPEVECQLSSDCPGTQICANVGICIDECVTDKDCFLGTCNAGTCVPDAVPDGAGGDPGPGDPAGDPGGDPGGDPSPGDPGGDDSFGDGD